MPSRATAFSLVLLTCLYSVSSGCDEAPKPVPVLPDGTPTTVLPAVQEPAAEAEPVEADAAQFPAAKEHAEATLEYHIIEAPNGTYGYDIFSNGRLFVHQTNLPGQPGIEGCSTREDAEKLATMVIAKIRRGEMPPSVTKAELNSLQLIRSE